MTALSQTASEASPHICPACGSENLADAVFCADARCGKALGDFRYVREELATAARWHETLAERVVTAIGKPHFLGIHVLWFAAWMLINTGVVFMVHRFDEAPFSLLAIILSMETIFITGFVLISENRQSAHANKRAELDYEVNVLTYRKLGEIETALQTLVTRVDHLETVILEASGH